MEVRDSQHLSGPSYSRLISPRESFGLQNNSSQSQSPAMQNMRLEFSSDGTPVYKPLSSQYTGGGAVGSGNGAAAPTFIQQGIGMSMEEPMKRKRGRPRKYEPDGKIAIPVTTVSQASAAVPHLGGSGFSSPTQSQSSMKKARGRPPGSGKKHQMAALGAAGVGFTPHVITVKAGEDVSSKIISFSQHGARDICIMSANGAISNVTLRQAATTGGTVTYEGRFEILSLSGSFFMSEVDGQRSRTGGLSVSLAGSDGRVLGGGVAGLLTAASPVQVFEGVRAELWYKPQVSLYADMVEVLSNNGLFEKVELLISYLKKENLEADAEGFNTLLRTLINYDMFLHSMECFHLMKVVGCEVEESTFRILINGFESKGKTELSGLVRQEAEKYFGEPLEFLEEKEETVLKHHHLWK